MDKTNILNSPTQENSTSDLKLGIQPKLANLDHKEDIYAFQTKNHLSVTPNHNIRESQVKDIPVFLTRLINTDIFMKDLFWIVTTSDDQTKIIASIGLSIDKNDNTVGEVNTFSVDENYRNKGLGTNLIKYCLAKAKEYRLKRLYLVTTTFMTAATSLYMKFGFRSYKEILIRVINGESKVTEDQEEYDEFPEEDKFKATFYELFL